MKCEICGYRMNCIPRPTIDSVYWCYQCGTLLIAGESYTPNWVQSVADKRITLDRKEDKRIIQTKI